MRSQLGKKSKLLFRAKSKSEMGANNSKSPDQKRHRAKDENGGHDVVRNKHVNDKNSNRLTHQEAHRPESKLKYDDNSPKAVKIPNGQKTTHAEHIHRGSAPSPRPTSHYVNHSPSGGRASYLAASAGEPRPPRRQRRASDSSDDDYLDVPQIIRSVPENEGRVNVRDRISQFTETQTQHTRLSGTPPSSSHVTSASNMQRKGSDPNTGHHSHVEAGPPPVATKPHVAQHHLQENTRGSDDFPGNSSKDWEAENSPLPPVDYDNRKQATRMNTLEYLDQVPREQALLKGFEKAKPAARNKKGVSPQNRFHKPKHLRDEQLRPQSMFEPSLYSSDLDLSKELETERLASINNRTGQKYAIDDTAYETLSRKKKIAGQRLPIGEVDEQTESNFLKSLKRNIKLRQAKQQKNVDRTDAGGFQDRLGDVVF